jgi:hypothetical protein
LTKNELSFNQTTRQLTELLAGKYGPPGKYWDGYVTEVYKTSVIFHDQDMKCWMQSYKSSDSGVELVGDRKEVVRVSGYQTMDGKSYVGNEQGELTINQETEMAETKFDKKAYLQKLVANKRITENQIMELEKLSDDTIQNLFPNEGKEEVKEVIKEVIKEVPANPVVNNAPTPAPALQDWFKTAPPEVQRLVTNALATEKSVKDGLVANIVSNPKNTFAKEWLETQEVPFLKGLAAMATPEQPADLVNNAAPSMFGNYLVANGAPVNNAADKMPEDVLAPVEMSFTRGKE